MQQAGGIRFVSGTFRISTGSLSDTELKSMTCAYTEYSAGCHDRKCSPRPPPLLVCAVDASAAAPIIYFKEEKTLSSSQPPQAPSALSSSLSSSSSSFPPIRLHSRDPPFRGAVGAARRASSPLKHYSSSSSRRRSSSSGSGYVCGKSPKRQRSRNNNNRKPSATIATTTATAATATAATATTATATTNAGGTDIDSAKVSAKSALNPSSPPCSPSFSVTASAAVKKIGADGSDGADKSALQGPAAIYDLWWALEQTINSSAFGPHVRAKLDCIDKEARCMWLRVEICKLPLQCGGVLGAHSRTTTAKQRIACLVLLSRLSEGDEHKVEAGKSGGESWSLDVMYDNLQPPCPVNFSHLPKATGYLGSLPVEVVFRITSMLDARSVRALGCTCQRMQRISQSMHISVIPHLRLPPLRAGPRLLEAVDLDGGGLLPHQRAVVRWMVQREAGQTCGSNPSCSYREHPEFVRVAATTVPEAKVGALPTFTGAVSTANVTSGTPAAASTITNTDDGAAPLVDLYINRATLRVESQVPTLHLGTGGCLSDRPGLGKTVSAIALCLWKLGLPARDRSGGLSGEELLERLAETYWLCLLPEDRRDHVSEFLKNVTADMDFELASLTELQGVDITQVRPEAFQWPVTEDVAPGWADIVPGQPDLCFRSIAETDYESPGEVLAAVRLMFVNSSTYNPKGHPLHHFSLHMLEGGPLDGAYANFVQDLAQLGEKRAEGAALSAALNFLSLHRAYATLIVVPQHLVKHWRQRCETFVGSRGFVPHPDGGPPRPPLGVFACDSNSGELPPLWALAHAYWAVIVSTSRFSHGGADPLLRVAWPRVLIDEGDEMGANSLTRAGMELRKLCVDHRWLITGTPAASQGGNSGLGRLRRLLSYVGEPPFGDTDIGGGNLLWRTLIQTPIEQHGRPDAMWNLSKIISRAMVIHPKTSSLVPPPTAMVCTVPLSKVERDSYNARVGMMLCNVALTLLGVATHSDTDPDDPQSLARDASYRDSYLNPDNYSIGGHRGLRSQMERLREACVVGDRVSLRVLAEDRQETLALLRAHAVAPAERVLDVDRWMRDIGDPQVASACQVCSLNCKALVLTECGHKLCPECLIKAAGDGGGGDGGGGGVEALMRCRALACPVANCGHACDLVRLVELQPGFAASYREVGFELDVDFTPPSTTTTTSSSTTTGAAEVDRGGASEVGEWWRRSDFAANHGKAHEILRQLDALERSGQHFKAIICSQFRRALLTVGDKIVRRYISLVDADAPYLPQCLPDDIATHGRDPAVTLKNVSTPTSSSSSSVVDAAAAASGNAGTWHRGYLYVADYMQSGVGARAAELSRFVDTSFCNVLLLSGEHAKGLDLSCVTHIFVLEEMWDQALWRQLVARASRLGARNSVQVQSLVAKHTIEETMREHRKVLRKLSKKYRTYYLLRRLCLIGS